MRKFDILAFLLLATISQASFAADTVFVIRHLQKAEGADPALTAEGVANAQALASMLAKSGIRAIFATPTRRTMQTAQPLATLLGLTITPYDPAKPESLVKAVAAVPGAVLIVGHSNTVPDLVARFGARQAITMTDQDYGSIFVVTHDDGKLSEIKIRPVR